MECLGLHNKPTAEVHPGHMLTDPKEEEDEEAYSETVTANPYKKNTICAESTLILACLFVFEECLLLFG
jgi:hypothetical protein